MLATKAFNALFNKALRQFRLIAEVDVGALEAATSVSASQQKKFPL